MNIAELFKNVLEKGIDHRESCDCPACQGKQFRIPSGAKSKIAEIVALANKEVYEAHINEGFNHDDAMRLTVAFVQGK